MGLLGTRLGTQLGTKIGTDLAGDLFASVLALAAGRPVFNADLVIVDGGTGKVRSIVDWNNGTHVLDQATGANQVALPAAHADFAGKLCLSFTGAEWYQANDAAASWQFASDPAAGTEVVCTFTRTTGAAFPYLLATRNNTNGFALLCSAGTSAVQYLAFASGVSFSLSAVNGAVQDTPTYVRAKYFEGASPETALFFKSALATSGPSTLAASVAPDGPLNLGRRLDGSSLITARVREALFTPQLSAAGISTLQRYELATYGIAA